MQGLSAQHYNNELAAADQLLAVSDYLQAATHYYNFVGVCGGLFVGGAHLFASPRC